MLVPPGKVQIQSAAEVSRRTSVASPNDVQGTAERGKKTEPAQPAPEEFDGFGVADPADDAKAPSATNSEASAEKASTAKKAKAPSASSAGASAKAGSVKKPKAPSATNAEPSAKKAVSKAPEQNAAAQPVQRRAKAPNNGGGSEPPAYEPRASILFAVDTSLPQKPKEDLASANTRGAVWKEDIRCNNRELGYKTSIGAYTGPCPGCTPSCTHDLAPGGLSAASIQGSRTVPRVNTSPAYVCGPSNLAL